MAIDSALAAAAASPPLTTVGFGGLVGFLLGFVLKKLMKILAIVAGIFLAAPMYLEQQGIVYIHWDKLQNMSQGILSLVVNTVTSSSGAAGGSSLLSTTMMTNFGIPLTGSAALGFAIGIMKE